MTAIKSRAAESLLVQACCRRILRSIVESGYRGISASSLLSEGLVGLKRRTIDSLLADGLIEAHEVYRGDRSVFDTVYTATPKGKGVRT